MKPESFKSHRDRIFEKLEQLNQLLISENAKEKFDIDNRAFFEEAYLYIKDRLNLTTPLLLQETTEITSIPVEIETGNKNIAAFISNNNNIHYLTTAVNIFHTVLNRIKNFPLPLSTGNFDFSDSIANFQKTVKSSYESLEIVNTKLQDDLKLAQDDLAKKQTQITTLEKTLADKQTEIQNVLIKYNTDFEALKNNANRVIETERKKFSDDVDADRKKFKVLIDSDKEAYKEAFETQKADLEKQSTDVINNLQAKLVKAKDIVNIVSNVGVTGNYQKIANEHKKSANFFRWAALFFMVIMSGLLAYSIIRSDDFNFYKFLTRILATIAISYPAVYVSRESARHRNLETQNRNLELELASIGPFIENLPEAKKEVIIEELAKKYFGQHTSITSDKKDDNDYIPINRLENIVKALSSYIKK